MHRIWLALGALAGLAAVGLSAWAAHAAPFRLEPSRLAMLANGIQQQGWHALALLAVGLWAERREAAGRGRLLLHLAGAAFALGLLLFCGGVYAVAIGGISLGSVAPAGGMLLMAGWALLFVAALWRR